MNTDVTLIKAQQPRLVRGIALAMALLLAAAAAIVWWLNTVGDRHLATTVAATLPATGTELIERGRALAQLGHCSGCHTSPGGAAYAGGEAIRTPFGTIHGGNLSPDPETGLGDWSADDFWRALHNGRSKNGRLLNPAFPYENFTHLTRADSDALHAYFQSLPPVRQSSPPASLRFPANTQAGLAVWRALHFRPPAPDTPALPRGEYLTRGIAHCAACHGARNALGALSATNDFSGQLMPNGRAYAPPLPPQGRADTGAWTADDLVAYLKTGHARQGAALGVMAEVVAGSTQHVDEPELREMARWILSQPMAGEPSDASARSTQATQSPPSSKLMALGERVYADHCATCHGAQGQGVAGLYPPLAGNPRVARDPSTNLIRIIMEGGFGPATPGHPRPFGMPPFAQVLQTEEVAAVATYIRRQWNSTTVEVTPLEVLKFR